LLICDETDTYRFIVPGDGVIASGPIRITRSATKVNAQTPPGAMDKLTATLNLPQNVGAGSARLDLGNNGTADHTIFDRVNGGPGCDERVICVCQDKATPGHQHRHQN
jgi:hypothetical protein